MTRLTLSFDEVEHSDDLEPILRDLSACGATILATSVGEDDDTGRVTIEVEDKLAFRTAFRKTDSAEWLT